MKNFCFVPPKLVSQHFKSRLGLRNVLSVANMAAARIRPINKRSSENYSSCPCKSIAEAVTRGIETIVTPVRDNSVCVFFYMLFHTFFQERMAKIEEEEKQEQERKKREAEKKKHEIEVAEAMAKKRREEDVDDSKMVSLVTRIKGISIFFLALKLT